MNDTNTRPQAVDALDLPAMAAEALTGIIAAYRAAGKDTESEAFRMHLAAKVAEEGAEVLAAYLHVTGWARRPGTWDQFDAELADTVISAFLAAEVNGRDLYGAIAAKHAIVMARGFKDPVATPGQSLAERRIADVLDAIQVGRDHGSTAFDLTNLTRMLTQDVPVVVPAPAALSGDAS